MGLFDVIAALITLVAFFSWANRRWIRLPMAIGLMLVSLLFSLGLIGLGRLGVPVEEPFVDLVASIDFERTILHGMLGALLFAGALQVDLEDLSEHWRSVSVLATAGVLITTLMVGGAAWCLLAWTGASASFLSCLLFGALMAPTDPIAVISILREAEVPTALETKLVGESLFNDGMGVVVFVLIADVTARGGEVGWAEVAALSLRQVGGGLGTGALLGVVTLELLRSVEDYEVKVLMTLAVVTGGYALAQALGVSAPLAVVVAGLMLGNRRRRDALSDRTRERVDGFWELVDALLNAVLFVLIGLEMLALDFSLRAFLGGLVAIVLVLGSRFLTVGALTRVLRPWRNFEPHAVTILTWSGLRGGISVALALSIPEGPDRGLLVVTTYLVVSFSILVQGPTSGRVARALRA